MLSLESKIFEIEKTALFDENQILIPIPEFTIPNLSHWDIVIITTQQNNDDDSISAADMAIVYRDSQNKQYLGEIISLMLDDPQVISIPQLADFYELKINPHDWISNFKMEIWKAKDTNNQKLDVLIAIGNNLKDYSQSIDLIVNSLSSSQTLQLAEITDGIANDTSQSVDALTLIKNESVTANVKLTELKTTVTTEATANAIKTITEDLQAKLINLNNELIKLTTGVSKAATETTQTEIKTLTTDIETTIQDIGSDAAMGWGDVAAMKAAIGKYDIADNFSILNRIISLATNLSSVQTSLNSVDAKIATLLTYTDTIENTLASETTLGTTNSKLDTLITQTDSVETSLSTRASETTLSAINNKLPAISSGRVKTESYSQQGTVTSLTMNAGSNFSGWTTITGDVIGFILPAANAVVFYFEVSDGTSSASTIYECFGSDGTTRMQLTGSAINRAIGRGFLQPLEGFKGLSLRVRATTNVGSALTFKFIFTG